MFLSPLLPSGPCHWMPNSAALSALTSAIRLSTNTCARRWSSRSITARSWRYCGSGAVMISELVAGSAWICPPVDGWAEAATGAVAALAPAASGQRG
jgi:hypothetical protein